MNCVRKTWTTIHGDILTAELYDGDTLHLHAAESDGEATRIMLDGEALAELRVMLAEGAT